MAKIVTKHVVKLVRADGSHLPSYFADTAEDAERYVADATARSGCRYVIEIESAEEADMDALFGASAE